MYDELDERTADEKRRELEREKKKRRRKVGFIIGIIGAALLILAIVLGAIALDHYWEENGPYHDVICTERRPCR